MTDSVSVPFPAPGAQARNFAGLAQLFGLLGIVAAVVGAIVCPLVLYFIKRDEEPFVAFHALQAALFTALMVGGVAAAAVVAALTCGLLIPLVFVVLACWLFFGILGTVAAFRGEWSRLPLVGGWALERVIGRAAARAGGAP